MKIGVVTHWRTTDNYGQILQCYALQKYLKLLGHEAFLIRYSPSSEKIKSSLLRSFLRKLLCACSAERRKAYAKVRYYSSLYELNSELDKKRAFGEFREANLEVTEEVYSLYEQLRETPPIADAYIVGSDQVWSPSLASKDVGVWYLDFAPQGTKRIAYAASVGRQFKESEKKILIDYLKKFTAISLREHSVFEYCQKIGFKDSKQVVDPTLLLPVTQFLSLAHTSEHSQSPYLFIYYLNVASKEELYWSEVSEYVKSEGLGIRAVSSSGYYPAMNLIPEVDNEQLTIPEWISAIRNSNGVLTTSFHGTVFSILFHKPFVVIPLQNEYSSGNSRLTSFLGDLGLSDRILTNGNSVESIFNTAIDWEKVDSLVESKRQESAQFLFDALK